MRHPSRCEYSRFAPTVERIPAPVKERGEQRDLYLPRRRSRAEARRQGSTLKMAPSFSAQAVRQSWAEEEGFERPVPAARIVRDFELEAEAIVRDPRDAGLDVLRARVIGRVPNAPASQPRTPARKAGVLDLGKRIRARDGLSPLDGDGFEPSVPRKKCFGCPVDPAAIHLPQY